MKRMTTLLMFCALVAVPTACNKKDKGTENPDGAEESGDSLAQLQAIPDEIQAEVDAVMKPIDDSEKLVDDMTALPEKHNIDMASLKGAASATLENGTVTIEIPDLEAEAKAEIEATLNQLTVIVDGLKATPETAATATQNIVALGTKATGLVTKLTSEYSAKLKNPMAKADVKAKLQAELDQVTQLDAEIKTLVADAQTKVKDVPAMGTEALAKLTASFAGGASADAAAE